MQAVIAIIVFSFPVLVPDLISFIFAKKFEVAPTTQMEIAASEDKTP
jgi:hypothetical protein